MPQLDISTYTSQLFWLAITFFLMYFVMAKYVLPAISGVLQNRQERVSNDIDKAEALKEEAESLRDEYQKMLEEARAKANTVIHEAADKAHAQSEKAHAEQDKTLAERIAESEKNIIAARNKAMSKLSPITSELTRLIVKKVANVDVTSKQADVAVNALLKDIK